MPVIIGSARSDENKKYSGGKKGDQRQTSVNDFSGEVSMQPFYNHKKGWYVLRPKYESVADQIALKMKQACNNPNIGYSQSDRTSIIKNGITTNVPTNCDCSSLVRECIREATGKDVGNFTTGDEAKVLEKSGIFNTRMAYKQGMNLYSGDVLVTKEKGHTAIVTDGVARETVKKQYYPKPVNIQSSIVDALRSVGEKDTTFNHRKEIAKANGINDYAGSATQNLILVNLLNEGKLIKP
jgi:hypothetical protein